MKSHYDPQAIEAYCHQLWDRLDIFRVEYLKTRPTFTIPLPPPNVTGTLHMGHAFQQTLMDILIRFHRMCGKNVHWQAGTDHAGIATQLIVQKELESRGVAVDSLSREEFIKYIWQWRQSSGNSIFAQMKRLGVHIDPQRARFTLDPDYCHAVQVAFQTLYDEGLIYRGLRLVNWDSTLQTAISDLEVTHPETAGHLWSIRYPLTDPVSGHAPEIVVATTRPETLLGDVAIAVHPDDTRYQWMVGRAVYVPLCQRKIPIIAESTIDPTFGSGAVKITPAHDFEDYKIAKRHQLDFIKIFGPNAQILQKPLCYDYTGAAREARTAIPLPFRGLSRSDARRAILSRLRAENFLIYEEACRINLPISERSGALIEPHLTHQWFLNTKELATNACQAVQSGTIEFIPKTYENLFFSWMGTIEDWCLSRQLVWGHPIPAWYDPQGKVYVGKDEAEVRTRFKISPEISLHPDQDVLDTWFSSALWTFASLGWPTHRENLRHYHPTSLLITGFDIIFFWVARMIMLTLRLNQSIPFQKVYITGLIRDSSGEKMSKSKGNVIDPIDMIDGISASALIRKRTQHLLQPQHREKVLRETKANFPGGIPPHGSDALRMTLSALASHGRDIRWDMQRLAGYRNFCNKLWNATRLVSQSIKCATTPQTSLATLREKLEHFLPHQWFTEVLNTVIHEYTQAIEEYRFDKVTSLLHDLVWHKFCDWYLEISKPFCTLDSSLSELMAVSLFDHLDTILRMAHPVLPFLTEYLWHELTLAMPQQNHPASILLCPFPTPTPQSEAIRQAAQVNLEWLKSCTSLVRLFRRDFDLPPKAPLTLLIKLTHPGLDQGLIEKVLAPLLNPVEIQWIALEETGTLAAPHRFQMAVEWAEVWVEIQSGSLSFLFQRRKQEQQKLEDEILRLRAQLRDPIFLQKAPAAIVNMRTALLDEKIKQKNDLQKELTRLIQI